MGEFTIILYGRTMAGKSTLMEVLRHGDGSSIGKGAQRTTLDVRAYHWNGLKIFDVPGTCSFGGEKDDNLALAAAEDADLALFLLTDDAPQPYEAERLGELKKLGKPVLGIVNVKQVLSPDSSSAKRKLDIRQLPVPASRALTRKLALALKLKKLILTLGATLKLSTRPAFTPNYIPTTTKNLTTKSITRLY